MRKYLTFAKSSVLEQMAYPSRFFTGFFINAVFAGVMIIIWSIIYRGKPIIDGYSFANFATYMSLSLVIREITASGGVATSISRHIRRGILSQWLLKPVSFSKYLLVRSQSWRAIKIVIPAIFFAGLVIAKLDIFSPPQLPGLFLISLVLGTMVNLYIYSLIGSIAFWTVNVWGVISIFGRVVDILSGSLFPLDFLPSKIEAIFNLLPFKYMHYAPISIYLGRHTFEEALKIIGVQMAWIAILGLLYRWVWSRGLKKYDSVGN